MAKPKTSGRIRAKSAKFCYTSHISIALVIFG
ncbi:hypothetical protein HD_0048 [[Haemophilus] ducreyi 35000HP]|uniref:Uncharacterized protein n=1 Tax=Haemophilus ducreyi (strain 35000HP / ATCC 700724) TaxID=233412 RepID=Q7VPL6_HAEDU|nr:hypothetical protein HD_0048 [[Haemophilus] ducreyi 35000HP]